MVYLVVRYIEHVSKPCRDVTLNVALCHLSYMGHFATRANILLDTTTYHTEYHLSLIHI